jgi:hypothetical protein
VSATPVRAVTIEGLVLKRDVYIPGVVVSAKLIRQSGTLRGTVGIRGKLAGRLRLHGRRMSGRVGGTRVRLPAALAARAARTRRRGSGRAVLAQRAGDHEPDPRAFFVYRAGLVVDQPEALGVGHERHLIEVAVVSPLACDDPEISGVPQA